jgi:hypothetical protein
MSKIKSEYHYKEDNYYRNDSKHSSDSKYSKRDERKDDSNDGHKRRHSRSLKDDYYWDKRDRRSHSSKKHSSHKSKKRRSRDSSRSSSSSPSDCSSVKSLTQEVLDMSSSESSDEETKQKKALIAKNVANHHLEQLERLDRQKELLREEKKRQKELMKALETPEQKRLRRLAKKEAKEKKRKKLMGWDEEYMGYTNADNPFGDANLHKTFVWSKKYEKLGLKNLDEEEIDRINKEKMELNKKELEKVKQRRLEREREREERMEELARTQREKEAEQFKEWEKQEDYFHLKQAKLRSKLRIREGRAKPIDLLARYINAFGDDIGRDENSDKNEEMASELVEPYLCLNGLRITDLEDLHEDIKVYMELDSEKNLDYWTDLQIIVEDELYKLKRFQTQNTVDRREGINAAVSQEVIQVFKGKTPAQLQALKTQIEKKINSNEEGIDIGYWETLLSRLKAHIARARLREMHEQNLIKRLNKLKHEQNVQQSQSQSLFPCVEKNFDDIEEDPKPSTSATKTMPEVIESQTEEENTDQQIDPMIKCINDYELGQYSPIMLSMSDLEAGTLIIEPEEDLKQLEFQRNKVLKADVNEDKKKALMTAEEIAFEREARKGMNDDEAVFSVEETLKHEKNSYSWSDKYRPRKPRYFNRVHTGFEWNKYNQTHYDVDNPPPKVVQGYKFNIFYPDLIDKSKTPTFKITPCPDNRDFAFIRFSSGPPYEDICFKIVNREWNYSYKSGFRSQFQNNILQLWFHFKRYRYRR